MSYMYICWLMGMKCNISSTYHPQSNGLDERINQTLQCQLLKNVNEEEMSGISTWMPFSSLTESLGKPFLYTGRQLRLPLNSA